MLNKDSLLVKLSLDLISLVFDGTNDNEVSPRYDRYLRIVVNFANVSKVVRYSSLGGPFED